MILEWFPKAVNVTADRTIGIGRTPPPPPPHQPFAALPLNDLQAVSGSDPHIPEGPGRSRLSSLSME